MRDEPEIKCQAWDTLSIRARNAIIRANGWDKTPQTDEQIRGLLADGRLNPKAKYSRNYGKKTHSEIIAAVGTPEAIFAAESIPMGSTVFVENGLAYRERPRQTEPQPGGEGSDCARLLGECERRAIEIYYAAPPEKLAGECRAELVKEFGEDCVSQMLSNGIGNNGLMTDSRPMTEWESSATGGARTALMRETSTPTGCARLLSRTIQSSDPPELHQRMLNE